MDIAFAAFWVLPQSSVSLVILRVLALLLNLGFLSALGAIVCLELPRERRAWAAACIGLMVFNPVVAHFLIEFRPDALANALLFSALLWLKTRGDRRPAHALVCGFFLGAAVLVNTKYLLLPFIFGGVALIMGLRQLNRNWNRALAVCLGFGAALLTGRVLLALKHISFEDAWRMVVEYNTAAEKARSFVMTLAGALKDNPLSLTFVMAGLIGCAVFYIRKRRIPSVFMASVFVLLLVNLISNARPWKQYTASWLLLAACLPARSLPALAMRLTPKWQACCAGGLLILASIAFCRIGPVDPDFRAGLGHADQVRVIDWILTNVPAQERVLTSYQLHPVFRRDVFFKTVGDMIENRGDGLEQLMPQLAPGSYAEHFKESGYAAELESKPPALVMPHACTEHQGAALSAFLQRHNSEYSPQNIPGTPLMALLRNPDGNAQLK